MSTPVPAPVDESSPPDIRSDHVRALASMLRQPARYTQRFVEELTFEPRAGHRWRRTLQLCIPADAQPAGRALRVVSLGSFERKRFADMTVLDAAGARINLLTREQHGTALTRATLAARLPPAFEKSLEQMTRAGTPSELRTAWDDFYRAVYAVLTSVGEGPNADDAAETAAAALQTLLETADFSHRDARKISEAFADTLAELLLATQYLCWVEAAPGETVNLQVTYTTVDGLQALDRPPYPKPAVRSRWRRLAVRWYRFRSRRYREFGLAPLNYTFTGPSRLHAGSYYFTIDPPSQTRVTHLDCSEPSSLVPADGMLDCARPSVHLHDGTQGEQPKGWAIYAFLRPDLREHKLIAGTALLNLAFVLLIGDGRLTDEVGASNQTWVLLTPTLLTAFLAQQQRHYYAFTTRRQRGVLWFYLAISVLFVVAVSFSLARVDTGSGQWGWGVRPAALLLAISSAIVLACYMQLGYWSQQRIRRMQRRGVQYKRATIRLADRICLSAIALVAVTLFLFGLLWSPGSATSRLRLAQVRLTTGEPAAPRADARFTVNQSAFVTLTVVREGGGVQVEDRCVPPRSRHDHARTPCDLLVQQLGKPLPKGDAHLRGPAPLRPGTYRLSIQATPSQSRLQHVVERTVDPPRRSGGAPSP